MDHPAVPQQFAVAAGLHGEKGAAIRIGSAVSFFGFGALLVLSGLRG